MTLCTGIRVLPSIERDLCRGEVLLRFASLSPEYEPEINIQSSQMMLFTRHLKLTATPVCALALRAHGRQALQHIKINQLSMTVDDVVLPLPNESFGARNKLGLALAKGIGVGNSIPPHAKAIIDKTSDRSSNSGRLGRVKAFNQYRQCWHFCRIS